jgi:hypothetical protein
MIVGIMKFWLSDFSVVPISRHEPRVGLSCVCSIASYSVGRRFMSEPNDPLPWLRVFDLENSALLSYYAESTGNFIIVYNSN